MPETNLELERRLAQSIYLRLLTTGLLALLYSIVAYLEILNFDVPKVLFLIALDGLVNQPYKFWRRRVKSLYSLAATNLIVDIMLVTTTVHFLGAMESATLLLAYVLIIVWAGITLSHRYCYLMAGLSSLALTLLVVGEHMGWWHHYYVMGSPLVPAQTYFILLVCIGLFFIIAFFISMTTSLLHQRTFELFEMKATLEKKVGERTRELEERQLDLKNFLYATTHDLKSPVVSIHGFAALLQERTAGKLSPFESRLIERIEQNAYKMASLLQDLVIYAQIGSIEESPERVNVDKLVREILELNKERCVRSHVKLKIMSPLPSVCYPKSQLIQIFHNLIDNALKFSATALKPRIEIGGCAESQRYIFHIKDNGIGIAPDYHEKIFEAFTMLKDIPVEGTGMGLAIVRRIVELQKGRIWLESEAGKGATFYFSVPRIELDDEGEPLEKTERNGSRSQQGFNFRRLL